MDDRLITLAIHTYDRAMALKSILENEGIKVALQNVNLDNPSVTSGVRVRISERDLPLALRIVENLEIINPQAAEEKTRVAKSHFLVPVDFSPCSNRAADLAFSFAAAQNANITLLHSFVDPLISVSMQLTDSLNYEMEETEEHLTIEKEAQSRMRAYTNTLRSRIKNGELPPIKFRSEVIEGVPEEAINMYAKQHKPSLIVMGTRGADAKQRELVGSVTGEVLDTCRFSVFTVPESVRLSSTDDIHNVVFFTTLDQADLLALDALARLFNGKMINVTLVNVQQRKPAIDTRPAIERLLTYCSRQYPSYTFASEAMTTRTIDNEFANVIRRHKVDLIVVPNKKKNVFTRLFNPGMAHRLLFHADIPMLVIPV